MSSEKKIISSEKKIADGNVMYITGDESDGLLLNI